MKNRSNYLPHDPDYKFERGGLVPFWEQLGIRKAPNYMQSQGWWINHPHSIKEKGMYHVGDFKSPRVFILTYMRKNKPYGKVLRNYLKALENDFGFKGREINFQKWKERGIVTVYHDRDTYKDPVARQKFIDLSNNNLGCVFIVIGRNAHRTGVWIDNNRHLVMYAPHLGGNEFPNLNLFKSAAEYLNVVPDLFRPE